MLLRNDEAPAGRNYERPRSIVIRAANRFTAVRVICNLFSDINVEKLAKSRENMCTTVSL